ncbi:MAG: MoaD/ThiS family protein [Nitrososphaerota archaeon]|nr:MoaD/ThiS family protein [Aigarchaeota archaeon]MDW8076132.1 MoaD/ThiS family protein [Nitrososphaerota archaeon]
MKIELIGHLRSFVDKGVLELKIEGQTSLIEVLKMLPRELREVLLEDGKPKPGFLLLLNGSDVRSFEKSIETLVLDEDTLTIIPIIHGG